MSTPIDISGTVFPRFKNKRDKPLEKFWFVKEQFLYHSLNLLKHSSKFSYINACKVNNRWVSDGKTVSDSDVASLLREMRLFYMKNECMSIHSFCTYMEKNITDIKVRKFFQHMRENWEEYLNRKVELYDDYSGSVKTNKQLIDAVLYSGNFHSQEKHVIRYNELLEYMDESLILMSTYNAMHSGYQMTQISSAIKDLHEDNLIILLPTHLRHEWDENCPYGVIQ